MGISWHHSMEPTQVSLCNRSLPLDLQCQVLIETVCQCTGLFQDNQLTLNLYQANLPTCNLLILNIKCKDSNLLVRVNNLANLNKQASSLANHNKLASLLVNHNKLVSLLANLNKQVNSLVSLNKDNLLDNLSQEYRLNKANQYNSSRLSLKKKPGIYITRRGKSVLINEHLLSYQGLSLCIVELIS